MTCFIKQPAGLGDILFCQKIISKLDKFDEIIWPIVPEFLWLSDYIETPAKFVDATTFHLNTSPSPGIWSTNSDGDYILNLQDADQWHGGCMMDAKYKAVELSYNNWAQYLKYKRYKERELELKNKLCINTEPYIVVNKKYGSPPNTATCNNMENIITDLRIIEMQIVDGYTLIDWIGVIEAAKEFHTVDTSIMYLIEPLNQIETALNCYSRFSPPNFSNVTHLFNKNWIYHGNNSTF